MSKKYDIATPYSFIPQKGFYKYMCKIKGKTKATLAFCCLPVLIPLMIIVYYATLPFAIINDLIYGIH